MSSTRPGRRYCLSVRIEEQESDENPLVQLVKNRRAGHHYRRIIAAQVGHKAQDTFEYAIWHDNLPGSTFGCWNTGDRVRLQPKALVPVP